MRLRGCLKSDCFLLEHYKLLVSLDERTSAIESESAVRAGTKVEVSSDRCMQISVISNGVSCGISYCIELEALLWIRGVGLDRTLRQKLCSLTKRDVLVSCVCCYSSFSIC